MKPESTPRRSKQKETPLALSSNDAPAQPMDPASPDLNGECPASSRLADALNWIIQDGRNPGWAAADWIAHDIDPNYTSAIHMLADPDVSLDTLDRAKDAYKTMRIVGEAPDDRRLGGRLYLASIAAALARHHQRITRQSDETLERSLREMLDDSAMPEPLRAVAGMALCELKQRSGTNGEFTAD